MNKGEHILNPDIAYLLSPKITDVIGQGLATVYNEKPDDPVDFLAKWLLKHSVTETQRFIEVDKEHKVSEARKKHKQVLNEQATKAKVEAEKQSLIEKELENFKQRLAEATDMAKEFDSFCEFLKNRINATGVYIGKIERKKKQITDESDDKGHVDESEPLMVRYIAANNDHKFLLDKTLKTDESFTFGWFNNKPTNSNPENAENAENKEETKEEAKVQEPEDKMVQMQFLNDVLKESKLKFFKVPRLGCYMAISLTHKTCLTEESLDKAYEAFLDVEKRKAEQALQKQQKEEEIQNEREEKLAAGEPYTEPVIEWPVIGEPPYFTNDVAYFICTDTLGQDREFTETEKAFAVDLVRHMGKCWEEAEKKRLTQDKELRAEIKKKAEEFKAKEMVEINEDIEKAAEDTLADEKISELPDNERDVMVEFSKLKCLAKHLTTGEYKKLILELTRFNIIKFPRIVQCVFYVLNYSREDICEPETNKLDWEKARALINEEFFTKLADYNPLGPKAELYPKYRLLNVIEKVVEEIKEEEVAEYSIGLAQLQKWIKEAIKVRKSDIAARKVKQQQQQEEREAKLKEKEEYEARRAEELTARIKEAEADYQEELERIKAENEKKGEFEDDEGEKNPIPEFKVNEKELMADWDEKNPLIEIPPEVQEELDNDYVGEVMPAPSS